MFFSHEKEQLDHINLAIRYIDSINQRTTLNMQAYDSSKFLM